MLYVLGFFVFLGIFYYELKTLINDDPEIADKILFVISGGILIVGYSTMVVTIVMLMVFAMIVYALFGITKNN